MTILKPFQGVFYDSGQTVPQDNVAPPYDIVSREAHAGLLAGSPHNIIRFTLGEKPGEPGAFDGLDDGLHAMLAQGILQRDNPPRRYIYRVAFSEDGQDHVFRGLVGLVDLQDEGRVVSHEKTMPTVKAGRRLALSGTRANIGLIQLACEDESGMFLAALDRSRGTVRFSAEVKPGEVHSIEECHDAGEVDWETLLADKALIIADGHHRFQTAQQYHRDHPEDPGARYCLVVLGSLHETSGLLLQPYHRVLTFPDPARAAQWAAETGNKFSPATPGACDLVIHHAGAPEGINLDYHGGDDSLIAFLENHCFPADDGAVGVGFARDLTEPCERLKEGAPLAVCEVRAVTRREFVDTVQRGGLFPRKSTYFYPKLYSGLVMRFLDEKPAGSRTGR